MSNTRDQLKRAHKLIQRDKAGEAEQIIRPILAAEPQNAEAWWMLAHAVADPTEVREALNKMLELDPKSSNASKAHELLAMLDREYPAEEAPSGYEVETTFSPYSSQDEEAVGLLPEDDFDRLTQDMFPSLDQPASGGREEREPAGVSFDIPQTQAESGDSDIDKLFQFETEGLDDEAKAALEEKAGRRGGRGRLLRVVIVLLLIPLVIVAALVVLTSGGGEKKKDPGALQAVQADSDAVKGALTAAEGEMTVANLGSDRRVIIAQSTLGKTLFVEFCSQPGPAMPGLIEQGMKIAAKQAAVVQNDVAAVGVSINLCNSSTHDTLYRVSAPVNDAVRYSKGDLGEDDKGGLAKFQATWKSS